MTSPVSATSAYYSPAPTYAEPSFKVDDTTPVESIVALLFRLHEDLQAARSNDTRQSIQKLEARLEENQRDALQRIELIAQKHLHLQPYQQMSIGVLLQKSLALVLTGLAVKSSFSAGVFMVPMLGATALILNTADSAINALQFIQQQRGYLPEETWSARLEQLFDQVLAPYYLSSATVHVAIDAVRSLSTIGILLTSSGLTTDAFKAGVGRAEQWITGANTLTAGFETWYGIQYGALQKELAELTAEQKVCLAIKNILDEAMRYLLKNETMRYKALEEITDDITDLFNQQADTIRHIISVR